MPSRSTERATSTRGKRLGGGQLQVRIVLIVAQQDVVARRALLDQVVLERERLDHRVGDDHFEAHRFIQQRVVARAHPVGAEVRARPIAQGPGLADIQRLAFCVVVEVDARLLRQPGDLLFEILDCHSDLYDGIFLARLHAKELEMPSTIRVAALIAAVPALVWAQAKPQSPPPTSVTSSAGPLRIEKLAALEFPWAVAALPDGRLLITEKPGRLRIFANGQLSAPVEGVPKTSYRERKAEQGGLLDVAVDPQFAQNRRIYLSYLRGG